MDVVSISFSMYGVLFGLLTWSLKAAMILAAASIMNPEYVPTDWQTFLLTVFIMIIHACLSSMVRDFLLLFYHILRRLDSAIADVQNTVADFMDRKSQLCGNDRQYFLPGHHNHYHSCGSYIKPKVPTK